MRAGRGAGAINILIVPESAFPYYLPTYFSLINNINLFINTLKNMISKEDLKLLLESRNMFMGIDVKEFIITTFGEHLTLCKFSNNNIETCACFHFLIQQYRVRKLISSYVEILK